MKKEITLQAPTGHAGFVASEIRSRVAASFRSIKSKYVRFFGLEDCKVRTERDKWELRTAYMTAGLLLAPALFALPFLYCGIRMIIAIEKEGGIR